MAVFFVYLLAPLGLPRGEGQFSPHSWGELEGGREGASMQPLKEIRILDLSRLLPGPYLTQLLADLGAEVIKVETPSLGDYARSLPPEMGMGDLFSAVNMDKKSLALDYRHAEGRELFLKLAVNADVIVESFRPGNVDKYGIGYDAVRAVNPKIVYCSISGYGQEGPYRQRAGHDLNYMSLGGAQALNGCRKEIPVPYGLPVADLSGGMLAAIAILGALVGGEGAYLDMALLDGVISWMTPFALSAHFRGVQGTHPLAGGQPSYNIYETADGKHISLAALEQHFWQTFCETIERPDLLMLQFSPDVADELTALFRTRTQSEWIALFADKDACVEAVLSIEEMLTSPPVQARGHIDIGENGAALRSPFVFARRDRAPAPTLGADTRPLLEELVLDEAEFDGLVQRGIVA